MEIKKAAFVTSIADVKKYEELASGYTMPEICVVGRSNVGKSSFINMITGVSKLAKTSSTPGRTRLVNLFNINEDAFMLVDLPGYGYAAAAKTEKAKWGILIEGYLSNSTKLKHVIVLVDIRHEASELDKQMLVYLYHYGFPFTIVATKCDKLSRAQLGNAVNALAASLSVGRDNIIPISATTSMGKSLVLKRFNEILL